MNDVGPLEQAVCAAILCALVLPTFVIGFAWYRFLSSAARARSAPLVVLILQTCSQGHLLAGMVATRLIGSDYSTGRYTTILVNLGLMLVVASMAAARGGPLRWLLLCASVWVAVSWLYVLAMSSVV